MLVLYCFIVFVIVTEVVRRFVLDFSSLWGEESGALRVHLPRLDRRLVRGQAARAHPLRFPDPLLPPRAAG